jgi:hypothetical protein
MSQINARRFISSYPRGVASFPIIFCGALWILGNSISPAIANGRITGPEAVARMSAILGSPQQFSDDMKSSTQDFIADHFGTMAIACAFGIAIRMRS